MCSLGSVVGVGYWRKASRGTGCSLTAWRRLVLTKLLDDVLCVVDRLLAVGASASLPLTTVHQDP